MPETRKNRLSASRPAVADPPDPLAAYRALERHCALMLEAARCSDWPGIERLGREAGLLIAELRERANAPLDPAARTEKFRLLRSILRIDAQIRHASEPWTRTVDRMLSASPHHGGEAGPGPIG